MPGPWVLVLNAGSSSLKYQVVDPTTAETRVGGRIDRIEGSDFGRALGTVAVAVNEAGVTAADLLAIGHRVVHGGPKYTAPTLVDDDVLADIEDLARLAPLHNPPALAGIRSAGATYPGVPQVAAFDTAFFADLPAHAATYALDEALARREGIRRYGMHGISHEYVTGEVARFLGRDVAELDQIVLHLGNGASAAAVRHGRPVDTSMGFTPLEGLVMGTRAGDLDPGVLVHLLRHGELDVDALEDLLHHHSGLQGLAGIRDIRDLEEAAHAGDERATLAWQVYCHRIRKYVGAYHAVLDGADVVTFTAGVGEHSARVRQDSLRGLDRLGIEVDPGRNRAGLAGARRISSDGSRVTVLVVPTNEELPIARAAAQLLT